MNKKKIKKIVRIKVENKERISQFIIDLKTASNQEIELEQESVYKKTENIFYSFRKKITGFKERIKIIFQFKPSLVWKSLLKKIKSFADLVVNSTRSISFKKIKGIYLKLSQQLFFLGIINLVYKLIFKISFSFGWVIIFSFRFFYLLIKKVAVNPIAKLNFSKIFSVAKYLSNFKFNQYLILKQTKINKPKPERKEDIFENFFEEDLFPSQKQLLKKALYFSFAAFILIMPFKAFDFYSDINLRDLQGRVLGASEKAFVDFKEASKSAVSMDFGQAGSGFTQASENFSFAQEELEKINGLFFTLGKFAPNQEIRLAAQGKHILAVGENISEIGKNMSLGINSFLNNNSENLIQAIDNFSFYCQNSLNNAINANQALSAIDLNALPSEMRGTFLELKEKFQLFEYSLSELENISEDLKTFLGATQDKRYLLVFQNNTEMRATGGFIGSYALVDFKNGKIKRLEVPEGGSYDTEAGLTERIISPEPLHLINPLWHFWDANWWPDWPTTAKKLMWFYEKSDGPTVDGVISFTPTIIEDLLGVIGEIDMSEDYGVKVNKDNFWITAQSIVESNKNSHLIDPSNDKPKKFIGDLTFKLLEELPKRIDKDTLVAILRIIEKNINEKQMLVYFNDKELQTEVENWGWSGKVKDTQWDYLSVINSNIAGGKTDRKIKEEIFHKTEVQPDGSLINTVKIIRSHEGIKNEPFSGVRNVNWTRIYVPQNSQLIEARGFKKPDEIYFEQPDSSWDHDELILETEMKASVDEESGTKIYNEANKTVFANWSMVDPGKSIEIVIKYKLPFTLKQNISNESYWQEVKNFFNPEQKNLSVFALMVQKQSGSRSAYFKSELTLPVGYSSVWQYGETEKSEAFSAGGWNIESELNSDKYWAAIIENN